MEEPAEEFLNEIEYVMLDEEEQEGNLEPVEDLGNGDVAPIINEIALGALTHFST